MSHPRRSLDDYDDVTGGDNVTSGDDQQETARITLEPAWIAGFVDGEGCFSVSLHKNERYASRSFGWQINPTFHVYQHLRHRHVLEAILHHFGVGRITEKGAGSSVLTYSVQRRSDVSGVIIPFFERHPLLVKDHDFSIFAEIVAGLRVGEHFTADGFDRLVRLAYSMNGAGKQRARRIEEILNGSSETVRQALTGTHVVSDR